MHLVLKCTKIHKILVHKPGSVFRKNKNLEINFLINSFYTFYTVYRIIFSNTDIIDNSVTIQIQIYDTIHA